MGLRQSVPKSVSSAENMNIFRHTIKLIDGTPLDLASLKGDKLAFLIVNVASY